MDRRTAIFLALTLSVCVCSGVCALGSVGVPYIKVLTVYAYRGALLSAVAGFLYRMAYSFKLEGGYNLTALRSAVQPLAASNGFQYTLYALMFMTGRPVPTVLFPLVVCSAYQVATIAHKHFADTAVYQRAGGERAFTYLQENMHRALMMCATMVRPPVCTFRAPGLEALVPTLAFRDFQLLKLKHDEPLSSVAMKCAVRDTTAGR